MNESQFTRNVNERLRAKDGSLVIWKLSDRFNAGRPDVLYMGKKTIPVEYKFSKVGKLPTRHTPALSTLQRAELRRSHAVNKDTRVLVTFYLDGRPYIFEYVLPEQWEQSTPLSYLRCYTTYQEWVDELFLRLTNV